MNYGKLIGTEYPLFLSCPACKVRCAVLDTRAAENMRIRKYKCPLCGWIAYTIERAVSDVDAVDTIVNWLKNADLRRHRISKCVDGGANDKPKGDS